MKTISELIEENVRTVLKHGPRLSYSYNVVVTARDRKAKMAILQGLGAMGVGMMWVEDAQATGHPGFEEGPEQEYPGRKD